MYHKELLCEPAYGGVDRVLSQHVGPEGPGRIRLWSPQQLQKSSKQDEIEKTTKNSSVLKTTG